MTKFFHLLDSEAHIHQVVWRLWKFFLRTEKTVVTLGLLFRKNIIFLFINCHLKCCWISFRILCCTRDSFQMEKFLINTSCICHNNHCFHPRLHPPKIPDTAELLESRHLCYRGIVLGGKRQWRAHRITLKGGFSLILNCVLPLWV